MPTGLGSAERWQACTGRYQCRRRTARRSECDGTTVDLIVPRFAYCRRGRLPTLRTRAHRITAIRCVRISDSCAPVVCVRRTCVMAISPAEVRRFDFERMECPVRRTVCSSPESTGGFECNGLWLLKNSPSRNSQKFHGARMRYKRRSLFWWTFSTPPPG
jgi:L-lysine 2,3-aminomutase